MVREVRAPVVEHNVLPVEHTVRPSPSLHVSPDSFTPPRHTPESLDTERLQLLDRRAPLDAVIHSQQQVEHFSAQLQKSSEQRPKGLFARITNKTEYLQWRSERDQIKKQLKAATSTHNEVVQRTQLKPNDALPLRQQVNDALDKIDKQKAILEEQQRLHDQDILQQALDSGKDPIQTTSGVNGSFFVLGADGKRFGVFKPMTMEVGGPKNKRTSETSWKTTLAPGQGAGNEVLAYSLDQALGGRYQIPRTELVKLKHPSFEGEELGSVQEMVPDSVPLVELNAKQQAAIVRQEFDRLNIKLITGGTDAHLGNFLYNQETKKVGIIDSGADFIGSDDNIFLVGQAWVHLPQASVPMSDAEYSALQNTNVDDVMHQMYAQAKRNEAMDPTLHVNADKLAGLKTRLILAKVAGEQQLTQKEWHSILAFNGSEVGEYDAIFQKHIKPHVAVDEDWQTTDSKIDWQSVENDLQAAVQSRIKQRPTPQKSGG